MLEGAWPKRNKKTPKTNNQQKKSKPNLRYKPNSKQKQGSFQTQPNHKGKAQPASFYSIVHPL